MSLSYSAMMFARQAHAGQVRKYNGNPYFDHVAEVAGIVSTVLGELHVANKAPDAQSIEVMLATAFLHDTLEDCPQVTYAMIEHRFGPKVALGVWLLSDLEKQGNRATRKAASCERLSRAPGWVQTIKCADLISNTSSIVANDPKFAVTYLAEKRQLLSVMSSASPQLWCMAQHLAEAA
jgi:(p)ppGpp synthase/HD superfamily hydrolase